MLERFQISNFEVAQHSECDQKLSDCTILTEQRNRPGGSGSMQCIG